MKLLLLLLATSICHAQSDTIFSNNQKIPCTVKEITPEAVKYVYEGEELINSMYTNAIQKIVFKNGRVQTFAKAVSFKKVVNINDFENVTITGLEHEVQGLFKVGNVSAIGKGATALSNQGIVKDRAYRKIKRHAAMLGANVVFITSANSESNKIGYNFPFGSSAQTDLTGLAFASQLPNVDEFIASIKDKKEFVTVARSTLLSGAGDITTEILRNKFTIEKVRNENGVIMIDGKIGRETQLTTVRVVSFDKDYFYIYFERKETANNIKVVL
jgi:hypothetical protein